MYYHSLIEKLSKYYRTYNERLNTTNTFGECKIQLTVDGAIKGTSYYREGKKKFSTFFTMHILVVSEVAPTTQNFVSWLMAVEAHQNT